MVSAPHLSVIVPVFNGESTLPRTASSILSQEFADFELIVVDDGSTDKSVEVASGLSTHDPRVRVITLAQNEGHGPARNRGIEEARGDYLVFVDADDELAEGALGHIAAAIAHSEADIYLLGAREVRPSGSRSLTDSELFDRLSETGVTIDAHSDPACLIWPAATWSKVYRRELITHHAISFPPGYHQDIPWSIETTLRAQSIGAVPGVSYRYLRHGAGSSTTTSKGRKTLARIAQVQRVRETFDIHVLSRPLRDYLVAVVSIHLIAGARAAYRTMPSELHEQYFHDSAQELAWWWDHAQPGRSVNSDLLLSTHDRVKFTKALLSDSWVHWNKTLARHRAVTKLRHYFDPHRWGIPRKR